MDYVIIVAGGKGLRMGTDIPKQFLPVNGKPILMRTIERFKAYNNTLQIVLVLPREQHSYWKSMCSDHHFDIACRLADGGTTRFESVKNGLMLIPDEAKGVVGVHDGVRPFVSEAVIGRCFDAARKSKAVIPVVPVIETLRRLEHNGAGENVLRDAYRLVQTPQTFDIALLKKAYRQPYQDAFTDDASVTEAMGQVVTMVEGNRENIKITTPFDMMMAETLAQREDSGDDFLR